MSQRVTRTRLCKKLVPVVVDIGLKVATDKAKPSNNDGGTSLVSAQKFGQVASNSISVTEAEDEDTTIIPDQTEDSNEGATSEEATPEPPIKRKRGRPRKNPESEVGAKRLKFKMTTGIGIADGTPPNGASRQVGFPVTPYPGKTGNTVRVPRPPNAFMIYGKENRRRFSLENPGSTNKEISKLLGEKWQSLDEETKSEYRESARKALQDHKSRYPNYQYIPTEARMRKKCKAAAKAVAEQERVSQKDRPTVAPVSDSSESNKENIPPKFLPEPEVDPTPARVITELFVAPPGYEDVEIDGLDKFVLWENKLIPYREWLGAEGDVKRLSGNYTQVPDQLLQPITTCVIAGTHLQPAPGNETMRMYPGHEGQRDSGDVVNTMVWHETDEQTLNECNACPSSEADKHEAEKSGSEMDAQRLLHDLMTGDVRSGERAAAVVVHNQPEPEISPPARRLFWNEASPSVTSEDDE